MSLPGSRHQRQGLGPACQRGEQTSGPREGGQAGEGPLEGEASLEGKDLGGSEGVSRGRGGGEAGPRGRGGGPLEGSREGGPDPRCDLKECPGNAAASADSGVRAGAARRSGEVAGVGGRERAGSRPG